MEQGFRGESVNVCAKALYRSGTRRPNHGVAAKLLPCGNVAQMHLHHGRFDGAYAVEQRDARVRIGGGIEHNAIVAEPYGLQFAHQFALDVALIVVDVGLRVALAQLGETAFHALLSVYGRLARAQKIEVGAVDDDDFHASLDVLMCVMVCKSTAFS